MRASHQLVFGKLGNLAKVTYTLNTAKETDISESKVFRNSTKIEVSVCKRLCFLRALYRIDSVSSRSFMLLLLI